MLEIDIRNTIEEIIKRLARAIQITRMYVKEHQLTSEAIDALYTAIHDTLVKRGEITIGIIGNEFAFEKEPLYEFSQKRKGFIKHLKALGINKVCILDGIEKDELLDFCKILGTNPDSLSDKKTIDDLITTSGIQHILLGNIGAVHKTQSVQVKEDDIEEIIKRRYQGNIKYLTKTFNELKSNQRLNVQSAKQIVDSLINNLLKNKNLLLMLTSMKNRNEDTFEHGINVAAFTLLQAEMLGIENKYLVDVGMSAMLHDIGRLSSPIEEDMADQEKSELKNNNQNNIEKQIQLVIKGAKILLETDGIGALPAIVAFEHNINYDLSSSGPKKLYGKSLNLISMMIAISDYYDKLRKKNSFYESGGPEKAYEEMMKLAGKNFHPDLLKNFFSVIGVFPPGTLVELDSKEVAMVIQASMMDIRRPQVEVLYTADGEKLKEPRIINMIEKDRKGQYKRSIIKSIAPIDDLMES